MKMGWIRFLYLALCLCMAAVIFGGCVAVSADRAADASADQTTQESDENIVSEIEQSELEQSESPSAEELRAQKRVITGKDIGFYAGMLWLENDVLPTSNKPSLNYPLWLAFEQYGDDVLYRVTFIIGGNFSDCDLLGEAVIAERYAYLDSLGIPFQEVERKYGAALCTRGSFLFGNAEAGFVWRDQLLSAVFG